MPPNYRDVPPHSFTYFVPSPLVAVFSLPTSLFCLPVVVFSCFPISAVLFLLAFHEKSTMAVGKNKVSNGCKASQGLGEGIGGSL